MKLKVIDRLGQNTNAYTKWRQNAKAGTGIPTPWGENILVGRSEDGGANCTRYSDGFYLGGSVDPFPRVLTKT
jgi:hypothetical protein